MIQYDWLDLQKAFSLFLRCKLDESDARTRLSIYSFKVKFIKKKKIILTFPASTGKVVSEIFSVSF